MKLLGLCPEELGYLQTPAGSPWHKQVFWNIGGFAESNIQCAKGNRSTDDRSKPDKYPLNTGILTHTSHPPDLCLVQVLVQVVKVPPPLEKHGVANEFEPRSEGQACVLEHLLQLVRGYVFVVLGLVRVDVEINLGLDK